MSCWTNTKITELELKIPKEDLPLKSDILVGYNHPILRFPEDEDILVGTNLEPEFKDGCFIFNISKYPTKKANIRDNYSEYIDEFTALAIKYKGTLVADSVGEDGEVNYIRIRNGEKKKIKIMEED